MWYQEISLYFLIILNAGLSRLHLKEALTLQGGEELREVFTFTRVSPPLNIVKTTVTPL